MRGRVTGFRLRGKVHPIELSCGNVKTEYTNMRLITPNDSLVEYFTRTPLCLTLALVDAVKKEAKHVHGSRFYEWYIINYACFKSSGILPSLASCWHQLCRNLTSEFW